MSNENLHKLATLIRSDRDVAVARWRERVRALPSARDLDTPTLDNHVPRLLDGLAAALDAATPEAIPAALLEGSPPLHALQRVQAGSDIAEVVAEYNVLRGCIHDLALAHGVDMRGAAFHVVNLFLDGAIRQAVHTFATRQTEEVRRRREEYLAFIAHDLRTPINAIVLAAKVLELKSAAGRDARTLEVIKVLQRNAQHLEELVDRILKENAHIEAESGIRVQRRRFDFWPLVEALIHELGPVAETAGTRLINQVPVDLPVYADAALLKRVLENLIANAIRYTPGGSVLITAREIAVDGSIECRIRDNGAGIPRERLKRVFEKHETDTRNGGTGLGLAIVKSLIEAHDGYVNVDSKEGEGTTFRFTLPGPPDLAEDLPGETA